ncbi:MAG: hypothetical protein A2042_06630 [Candidatus Schekmanbacteria bacterium GWA2_38_11]|uniref:Uncharacterized protein n=1 Tax=Candidatus Schekmanbacteria bacterium GWA2_38_11 TaxID=1817876 RepID=A0A1F7RKG2_9BACT|nr:MAG: hypothetical protein A2042_06630 [Candidatus Schekmanbacteria bacterium GWA2_38_11]
MIATAFTVFSGEYWLFSEIGDSYIVHTVFVIISLVMFIEKRFIFSGITYGIALLIYPQVGLVAPFYPIIAYRYCYGFKNFLKTVLSATIIYIPPIIILFHEYFWGRMGILPSMIHHVKVGNSYPFFFYLLNGSYYFIKSLHIAIPFIILGFYTSFFQNRFFFLLSIVLLPMHIYMYFDNPGDPHSYALTIYPFLGILGALGLMKILNAVMSCKKHLKILLTIFLIYVLLSFFFKIIQINKTTHDYRNFAESFHYNQNGDYRIISDWAICINYNFYTTSTLYSGKCISYKNLKNKKLKDFSLKGIRLYFLENKGGINPLKIVKTYLIQFIPKTHTIRPIKDSGSFAKGLLRNNPEYKFKLIKANSSFYLYELIPENI